MGKKRGGKKTHHQRSDEPKESSLQSNDLDNVSSEKQSQTTDYLVNHQYDDESNSHDRYRLIADYVRSIQPLVETLSLDHGSPDGKTTSLLGGERNLLIGRIFKEFKGRETAVMRDQRGSKVMEKIILILRQIVEEEITNPGSRRHASPPEDVEDSFTVIDAMNVVKTLLRSLAGDVFENCTNCYASHTAQTLFGIIPLYISIENSVKVEPDDQVEDSLVPTDVSLPTSNLDGISNDGLSLEDTFLYFCGVLRSAGIGHLMSHACGSHVIRSVFLTLAGYVSQKESRFRGKKPFEQKEPLPTQRIQMPESFQNLLGALRDESIEYATDTYANPVIQLVLYILCSMGKEASQLSLQYVSLYLPTNSDSAHQLKESLDMLLESPSGSRLIEACVNCATADHIHTLIWLYLKPSNHFNKIALSRYGNHLIQQLLSSKSLDVAGLRCIAEELDFKAIIAKRYNSVIWRLVDACRRLQEVYKITTTVCSSIRGSSSSVLLARSHLRSFTECTFPLRHYQKLLEALNVNVSANFPLLWWSLLSCRNAWDLPTEIIKLVETPKSKLVIAQREESNDTTYNKLIIDPVGCSIASGLLKFPKESIIPLLQAFKPFTVKANGDYLLTVAKDRQGSWLFQSILDPTSPIDIKSQNRLVRLFLSRFLQLAFHPYGSFVVSSAYKISPIDLKRNIVEELREKADELRVANYALYRAIEFPKYLENDNDWAVRQQAKAQVKNLFADILESPSQSCKKLKRPRAEDNSESESPPSTTERCSQEFPSQSRKRKQKSR